MSSQSKGSQIDESTRREKLREMANDETLAAQELYAVYYRRQYGEEP